MCLQYDKVQCVYKCDKVQGCRATCLQCDKVQYVYNVIKCNMSTMIKCNVSTMIKCNVSTMWQSAMGLQMW